jgi:hypothetical protein
MNTFISYFYYELRHFSNLKKSTPLFPSNLLTNQAYPELFAPIQLHHLL